MRQHAGRRGSIRSDDVTALATAAAGDPNAAEAFVAATVVDVWRVCAHLVDAATADDLTQLTYERALGSLRRFRGDSSARTWLLTIARRVCADEIRSRTRRRRVEAEVRSAPPGATTDFTDHDALVALIRDLGDPQRDAFVLTQVVGLRYDEAAAVLQCPVGTIRSRVARARDVLQDRMGAAEGDAGHRQVAAPRAHRRTPGA